MRARTLGRVQDDGRFKTSLQSSIGKRTWLSRSMLNPHSLVARVRKISVLLLLRLKENLRATLIAGDYFGGQQSIRECALICRSPLLEDGLLRLHSTLRSYACS